MSMGEHLITPWATLTKLNEQADRRLVRRALTPEEATRVVQAAETGIVIGGLTGTDRSVLYALALGTGFRADELRTLTPSGSTLTLTPRPRPSWHVTPRMGGKPFNPYLPCLPNDLARGWQVKYLESRFSTD